jgi:hypothetical protein
LDEPEASVEQLEQLKDLLSEPKKVIKLNDFLAEATKAIVSELNQPMFGVQTVVFFINSV